MKTNYKALFVLFTLVVAAFFAIPKVDAMANQELVDASAGQKTDSAYVATSAELSMATNVNDMYDMRTIVSKPILHTGEPVVKKQAEVEVEKKFVTSSPDITFSYEYVNSDVMPYALVTPSTAATNEKTPLIISLHGMGERGTSADHLSNRFIAKLMQNWEMDGFNAYVMIPHLTGSAYSKTWNNEATAERLFAVIDQVIEEYNIDTDRIIIQGQSMGGYGCLYMAAYRPEYFSAVVPVSSYNSNADLAKLEGMPIRCYVGTTSHGEDGSSVKFVTGKLAETFGEESIFQRETSHDGIPIVAFTEDLDGDNKSDLIEWMLSQNKSERENTV